MYRGPSAGPNQKHRANRGSCGMWLAKSGSRAESAKDVTQQRRIAIDIGGARERQGQEAVSERGLRQKNSAIFVRLLARLRAHAAPASSRGPAVAAFVSRWSSYFSFAAARAFAASLSSSPLTGTANLDGDPFFLSDILADPALPLTRPWRAACHKSCGLHDALGWGLRWTAILLAKKSMG